jgi:hypothetical protein
MERPLLVRAVEKLARAGEQAGLSVEDMIRILNAGVSVECLLDLIEQGLHSSQKEAASAARWLV